MIARLCAAIALLSLIAAPAAALEPLGDRGLAVVNGGGGEFFLTPVPIDWKVVRASHSRRIVHMAFIPEDQTARTWSDKVSIQMFPGSTQVDAVRLLNQLARSYAADCEAVTTTETETKTVRGYDTAFRFIGCTRHADSDKGELALFRTVAGQQSFYLVQRAWRTPPFARDELPFKRDILGKTRLWLQGGRACTTASGDAEVPPCPGDLADAMNETTLKKPITVVRLAKPGGDDSDGGDGDGE